MSDDCYDHNKVTATVGDEEIVGISSIVPERKCCICGLGSEAGYVASPLATMKDGSSCVIYIHVECSDNFGIPKKLDDGVFELVKSHMHRLAFGEERGESRLVRVGDD